MAQQFQSIARKRRRGVTVFSARPFEGAGVSIYASIGNAVRYRKLKLVTKILPRQLPAITKTTRIAKVDDPAESAEITLPAELLDQTLTFDIRRFQGDVENESDNAFTRTVEVDSGGDDATTILGSAVLLNTEIRAAGAVRLRFRYDAVSSGLQPETFTATATAGPTSPDDVSVTFVPGQSLYEIEISGLDDASPYTYTITATSGAVTIGLLTAIEVTADASGPPAPAAGTAEAW